MVCFEPQHDILIAVSLLGSPCEDAGLPTLPPSMLCVLASLTAPTRMCVQGTFKEHAEIAKDVAAGAPYKEWVNANHRLEDLVSVGKYQQETQMETAQVLRLQAANGELLRTC